MNTNIYNHYKDRNPLDTINIITNFFNNNGFKIKIKEDTISDVGTYSSRILLYYNDQFVLGTTGKGITREYSLASGYSEMYERFCSKLHIMSNPFINKKIKELNYKKNGYYLDKNEKIIDLNNNILISDKYIREFYKNFFNNDNEAMKKFISFRTDNNLIEVPYINLID